MASKAVEIVHVGVAYTYYLGDWILLQPLVLGAEVLGGLSAPSNGN